MAPAPWKDKGLFRREVPDFNPDLCTGCMECALVCPDAAIPNTVHEIHELVLSGIKHLEVAEAQREAMRAHVYPLSEAVRAMYRSSKEAKPFHELLATAAAAIDTDNAILKRNLGRVAEVLASFPVAKTRPFFDAMEKDKPGTGGLFSAAVDPWKCSGCLECIDVCGPGALKVRQQDAALLELAAGPLRVPEQDAEYAGALRRRLAGPRGRHQAPDARPRQLLRHHRRPRRVPRLRRGHGDPPRHIDEPRDPHQATQGPRPRGRGLIENLDAKLMILNGDAVRRERIAKAREILEKRLYLLESGPTGNGPASAVIANATGCSSVYASTFPFNPYNDPWVNSLFQDAPAVAKGLFEGLAASVTDDIKALRIGRLELDDAYDAAMHDKYFKTFAWPDFTPEEMALLPTVISMGGDGATYDIGFGALSRLLATQTPIKVVVLNTGAYSNTGGQASTASLTGQDSDLARFGSAHHGKQEDRKELGLIAAFHPNVFVVQASTALQGHFLKSVMAYLNHTSSPAVLDIYTPCQGEHGIADAAASQRSRLAVECRMSPVFVHDPRVNMALHGRFNLEGNPDLDKDWTKTSIEYVEDGATKLHRGGANAGLFRQGGDALPEAVPQARGRRRRDPGRGVRRSPGRRTGGQNPVRVLDRP